MAKMTEEEIITFCNRTLLAHGVRAHVVHDNADLGRPGGGAEGKESLERFEQWFKMNYPLFREDQEATLKHRLWTSWQNALRPK